MRRPGFDPGPSIVVPLRAPCEDSIRRADIGCRLQRLLGQRHLHDWISVFGAAYESSLKATATRSPSPQKAADADKHRDDLAVVVEDDVIDGADRLILHIGDFGANELAGAPIAADVQGRS